MRTPRGCCVKKISVAMLMVLACIQDGMAGGPIEAKKIPSIRQATAKVMDSYRSDGTVGMIADVSECWAERPRPFCLYLDLAASHVEVAVALDNGVPAHRFFHFPALEQRAQSVLQSISRDARIQHWYLREAETQIGQMVLPELEGAGLEFFYY